MTYKLFNLALFILLIVITSSYFGKYFWISEILSNFRLYYIVASMIFLILALIFKSKISVLLISVTIIIQAATIYQCYSNKSRATSKTEVSEDLTFFQYNTFFLNTNYAEIADYLIKNHNELDIIFLQEVTPELKAELKRIEQYYPYKVTIDETWFGRAFYSKIPILNYEVKYFDRDPADTNDSNPKTKDQFFGTDIHYLIVHLKTKKQSTPITFYGIHTTYPMYAETAKRRNNELRIIAEEISKDTLSTHKILAGDFNTTPYSYWFQLLEKSSGLISGERGTGINNTWPSWLPFNVLRISIDHVLVTDNIKVEERKIGDDLGSDHLSVISKLKIFK